ncbi:glycerol-3-phosphate 1-O-acyltransferase PlsY [Thalassotalea litorea]|uniref:Glycerol-3-phosphate acyltransferase n=1 Tax=Thalassotalea litorea TaxID=2020715 RepID=A0A5R9IV67_9GAMM|nr:glycerol-3-phosphate 1-O-acyltransferase PlsY [Thalassotalea litorea]TLU67251.1 glycerol-3-phosphate 1-O-acyltransferase PlsY [Thalassotalea litorea]
MVWISIGIIILAYLLGSISSAILICRLRGLPDPRTEGSQNPGATNVLRISNKATAAAVLFLDVLKGAVPVYGGFLLGVEPVYLGLIALAACLGHMYPVFFKFQGGKAVATAFGALSAIGWTFSLALITTWLLVFKTTKYSSLAAIVTVSLAPLYTFFLKPLYVQEVTMLSLLIIFRHRDNLLRLWQGEEGKMTSKHRSK